MAEFWAFLFGEKDGVLVGEIAKAHNVPKEIVEQEYKAMLERIKNGVQDKA
jgi:hypothetical protein